MIMGRKIRKWDWGGIVVIADLHQADGLLQMWRGLWRICADWLIMPRQSGPELRAWAGEKGKTKERKEIGEEIGDREGKSGEALTRNRLTLPEGRERLVLHSASGQKNLWHSGHSGSMVTMDLWSLWPLWSLWIYGRYGSMVTLDLWSLWIYGHSGSMDAMVLWLLWIYGLKYFHTLVWLDSSPDSFAVLVWIILRPRTERAPLYTERWECKRGTYGNVRYAWGTDAGK